MQNLHHLGIFAITLKLGRVLCKLRSNTIPTSYCDNILNHGTNEGIVTTCQNFIKVTLYHQCGQYYNTLMYIY